MYVEPCGPFGPEPLWILGHNTNSIEAVTAALDQGANAVEIDVTAYAHDRNALCIDHAGLLGDDPGRASAPAFEPFLRALRQVVDRRPELCLVEFDLKPPASRPELGPADHLRVVVPQLPLPDDPAHRLSVASCATLTLRVRSYEQPLVVPQVMVSVELRDSIIHLCGRR